LAHADIQQSSNYSMLESELGGTGDFQSNSASYTNVPGTDDSGSTVGDNAVGNSSSASYQTNSGFNTTSQPGLALSVSSSQVNLGALSGASASTATATFDVANYTTNGYVIALSGTPPSNSGHALTALTTDASSANNTEQFGINLVLNHSPANPVPGSADPQQVPGATFSYGVAGDGYSGTYGTTRPYTIDGQYRYNNGETVASAPKSSGDTRYTITFMANMSPSTPGGLYTGSFSIIATGTY